MTRHLFKIIWNRRRANALVLGEIIVSFLVLCTVFTTLAYFISHESHHRGSILLTLKTSGHPIDKKSAYAIWGWDRM